MLPKFEPRQLITIIGAILILMGAFLFPLIHSGAHDSLFFPESALRYTDLIDSRGYNVIILAFIALTLGLTGWTKPVWAIGTALGVILLNDFYWLSTLTADSTTVLGSDSMLTWLCLFGGSLILALTPFADRLTFLPRFYQTFKAETSLRDQDFWLMGIITVVVLVIGVFLPIYQSNHFQLADLPTIENHPDGATSLLYNGYGEGVHLLFLAAVIAFSVALRQYENLWIIGLGAGGILLNELRHAVVVGDLDIGWFFLLVPTAVLIASYRLVTLIPDGDSRYERIVLTEKLFQNGVLLGVPIFSLWFVISEWDGLVVLYEFVRDGILYIPESIRAVYDYFNGFRPSDVEPALYTSMRIGALVGAISTAIYAMIARGLLRIPPPDGHPARDGLIAAVIVYLVGLDLLYTPLIILITIIIGGLLLSHKPRRFFIQETLPALKNNLTSMVMFLLIGAGIGAIVGAISSQILLYPLDHCTYLPKSDLRTYERRIRFFEETQYNMGIGITVASAFILLIPIWGFFNRATQRQNRSSSGYFRNPIIPYLFLAPSLILLIVFLYYPASAVIPLSLTSQTEAIQETSTQSICMENYVRLLDGDFAFETPTGRRLPNTDYPIYNNSFEITLTFTMAIVAFTMVLALLIAILASQKVKGIAIYRTLLIWPYALSPIVTGAIFLAMFRSDSAGVINWILENTINQSYDWLNKAEYAPRVIIYGAVWNALGFNILFYMAGLQNIPKDLLEAAAIDGANVFQRFYRITLPLLSPFTFFLLIANITYAFYGIYGLVEVLTQGGPQNAQGDNVTNILIYKLYADAFGGSAAKGAAQAILLFLMVAVVTLFQFALVERRVTYSGD